MNQPYELLYLIPSQVTEDELPEITDKVAEVIQKQGGIIKYNALWGKRRLNYQIKRNRQAYYWLVRYEAAATANPKIMRELSLISKIIRFLITRPVTTEVLPERKKVETVNRPISIVEPTPMPRKPTVSSRPVKEKETKVSLEELDRKLDEILDDNNSES
ncbi:MAG: 30S ribosomal protein S6 [Patescibacteria group bacterium]|nr:30S ribosomal protein S6 [Patescibacteria group bacterium]